MKESVIAETWGEAMGLDPKSEEQQGLSCYKDPTKAGKVMKGDLANAVMASLVKRTSSEFSDVTIGKINEILDEICLMNRNLGGTKTRQHTSKGVDYTVHDAAQLNSNVGSLSNLYLPKPPKPASRKQKRIDWVRALSNEHGLSPIEQKWIIRIMMSKLDIGCNHESILKYLHPDMTQMYASSQNLEVVCNQLADAQYMRIRNLRKVAARTIDDER